MTAAEFLEALPEHTTSKKRRKVHADLPLGLALGTCCPSTPEGLRFGLVYFWAVSCGDLIAEGRTVPELADFLNQLGKKIKENMLLYTHDSGITFQYLKKHFLIKDIFAISERRPLYARLTKYVELRDGFALSGMTLQAIARELGAPLTVSPAFISPIYTPGSELPEHIKYTVYAEARTMSMLAAREIRRAGGAAQVPLTKTGYIRRELRDLLLYHRHERKYKSYTRYRAYMASLDMQLDEFLLLKKISCGGLVGLNKKYKRETVENAVIWDRCSSYTASMLYKYVPISRAMPAEGLNEAWLRELCSRRCVCAKIRLYNVRPKPGRVGLYLSRSKIDAEHALFSDGRLLQADTVTVCVTEMDFFCIDECYIWDSLEILQAYQYLRGSLPGDLLRYLLRLFAQKERLTGEPRRIAKEALLSVYGMCVMDPMREVYPYDPESLDWDQPKTPDAAEALEKYNTDKNRFLSYPWGIWIAAHTRRDEWSMWQACGSDWIYGDTDSAVCTDISDHTRQVVEKKNAEMRARAEHLCRILDLPISAFCPGKHLLGEWRIESICEQFRAVGVKKYIKLVRGQVVCVMAGLNPELAGQYIQRAYGQKTLENFSETLFFPAVYYDADGKMISATGRSVRFYIDTIFECAVKDETGISEFVKSESSVLQIYTPYSGGRRV